MRVAFNAMVLPRGEYSGVHVSIQETLLALQKTRPQEEEALIYARKGVLPGLQESDAFRIFSPFGPMHWRTVRILWEQFRLPNRLFKDACDILHGWTYIVPRLCLKPMTATVHDVFALQRPELCTRANLSHFKRMLPISLERAARIITPTEAVRQDVLRWGELRREEEEAGGSLSQIPSLSSEPVRNAYDFSDKTITIPWGVNHEIWRPASPEERAEARKSCGVDGPFFLIVARLEPKKNIPFAIRAWFAAVMAKKLPHALVLAGPKGWGAEKEIDAEARDLGMSNRFKRLGFVSRETLRGLYSETSALLMPSLAEGFGLPLLEGMACGAPVLAADIPSLREAAGASDNAILSNPGDLKQWREAIEAIAEDSDLRARLREAGLKRASMFSWQKTAQLYWKVYREEYEEDKKRREE